MTPTRTQLYAWAWRIPLALIGALMNMSSSNVRKICSKHRIPTPSRGFWRRFETGVTVEQEPLPDPENDPPLWGYQVDEKALQAALDGAKSGSMVLRAAAVRASEAHLPFTGTREDAGASQLEISAPPVASPVLDARRPHEQGAVSSASVVPTQSSVLGLAELHEKLRAAEAFLATVRCASRDCDPASRAVLTLWLDRAEAELSRASAARMIERACSRIASGAEQPDWWVAATSGLQRREP